MLTSSTLLSEKDLFRLDFVHLCDGADHTARHACRYDAGRNVVCDHTPGADDRACADGHTAADGGVGANPDVVLQCDGRGGADAAAALFRINGVAGTGQTDTRRDKGPRADMDRRCVQNHAVIVDYRQSVDVNIEAVIATEIGLDVGQRMVGAQKLPQDGAARLCASTGAFSYPHAYAAGRFIRSIGFMGFSFVDCNCRSLSALVLDVD